MARLRRMYARLLFVVVGVFGGFSLDTDVFGGRSLGIALHDGYTQAS
jgi:hypothetical protein